MKHRNTLLEAIRFIFFYFTRSTNRSTVRIVALLAVGQFTQVSRPESSLNTSCHEAAVVCDLLIFERSRMQFESIFLAILKF